MTAEDADAVYDVQLAAFEDLDRRQGNEPMPPPADRRPGLIRIRHLVARDPGGAWVTEQDGAVTGASLGLVREGLWGLSLLVVDPAHQSNGHGSALLRAALDHANGARGGIILASEDPRALRAYHRAGFALHPAIDARGELRRPPKLPPAVRPIRWPQDRDLVERASRHVRGASYADDVPALLDAGRSLLVHEDGGYAASVDARVITVAATDPERAAELLRGALSTVPAGEHASVDFLTSGQDWAIEVALDAGLALCPSGAVMVRGDVGPLRPYIPSGSYL